MFHNSWDLVLHDEMQKSYFKYIKDFIKEERLSKTIYPPAKDLFNAFRLTDFKDIKVVILGQDPYHGEKEAMGLSFSVRRGVRTPPSLRNIFKELKDDLKIERTNTDLSDWAKQGVFLLNTVLTVEKDKANSHKDIGWEIFTDFVIKQINDKLNNVVFILWGRQARDKKRLITNPSHYIIESAHPSPLSAYNGFFGSKPFSKTNNYLIAHGKTPINF
ncbi:MAG TPA: uracil-DNA glycosylase [Candidatus Aphodocola excrementigallinarum]|uniref:Uracil-DNA glycosylase n=1 Tax=Candidatus Aphodocola excrementigallinarum TaxID=2840670 RepID=A0A9D1LHM6_9FIRM|nr:uracil-DNA glycosylase [Candidatus Aphodocola excrementigallinarum]